MKEKSSTPCRFIVFSLFVLLLLSLSAIASAATEVTGEIDLVQSRMMYDRSTSVNYLNVSLYNKGSHNLETPVWVVFDNISTDAVTVNNPDGTTVDGKPYYLYDSEITGGQLYPESTSGSKSWFFNNPTRARFSFSVIVYAAGPPEISISNPLNGSVISDDTPYITLNFSDAGTGCNLSSFYIQIDGTDYSGFFTITDSSATYQVVTPLAQGSHVISASIEDNAGNTGTAVANFTVFSSTAPVRYIFSVEGNPWIFASPGDGTYAEYMSGWNLGLSDFSDIVALSKVDNGDDVFFSLASEGGILRSFGDENKDVYFNNTMLGLAETDRISAEHIGLDGSVVFSIEGQADVNESFGGNTYWSYLYNNQLGIDNTVQLKCIHIGYDNEIYFCRSDNSGIFLSDGNSANSQFLTLADLGVYGYEIDGFAIIPESTPPTINITNPVDGAFLNTITPLITVIFSDADSGIDKSTFYAQINGTDMTNAFTVTETDASYQIASSLPLPVGSNSLTVKVSDLVGNEAIETSNFTVGILRAIPGATPVSGSAPLTVYFSTDGEDPAGTIEIFRWDFDGNGSWDTYDTVARDYNHTYNTPGVYNAVLYVKSSTGESATATVTITVQNNPPTATANVQPSNGEVPLTVQLIGSGYDSDGSIVLYEWDYEGDGIYDWSSTTTGNTSYTYTNIGTFSAVFRVTDNSGLTATAHAMTTVIRTGPPGSPTATASANPTNGNAPLNVNLYGSATDPNNDVVLYEWDFESDGTYDWSSATSGNTSHTYTEAGTHTATFRVTDSTGLTGIDQILITVNVQTSLSIQKNSVGFLGAGMTASASSQYNSSYSPDKAIDGNTSSRWQSAYRKTPYYGVNTWFEIAYNTPQLLNGFSVRWYSSSYRMSRARIDVYDNNNSLIYSQEINFPSVTTSTVSLPALGNATRLRLTAITSANNDYVRINEFYSDGTLMPGSPEPIGTNINTSISAGSKVSILIKDADGNVVRTLVNNENRNMGSYADYWNCKDDNGIAVNDGVYYAVMQYILDGQVVTYDLTNTTGGTRSDFPISSGCNTRSGTWTENFSPFDDQKGAYSFTLCSAQEVTFFIGPLWGGSDPTRIRTILNREAFPAGTHTIYWDGLDDNGNIAQAGSGDLLITGAWRYSLPNNSMVMTGGRPEISNVSADPNYYSPFSEKCDENGNGEGVVINYNISEDVVSVELRVYSIETSALLRSSNMGSVSEGANVAFWDGKNNNGEYVDIGDYRIGLVATDAGGNTSMFRYTLVRIDY
ncbi:MAG: PKD domain-containing protein [Proteobacteria bacterium]|nr:PKD domain-containing protein [Pseudomonadota bacterium]